MASDDEEFQQLFDLVRKGDVQGVKKYLSKAGVELLSSRDKWGYTLVHWAALDGNSKMIRFFMEQNIPIDSRCTGAQGQKPIHWACRNGHIDVIDILLQAGVDVNSTDLKGVTPLMTASIYGQVTATVFLLGMGARHHPVDANGDTAVHWAAFKGHAEVIRLLINAGADLQKPDYFNSTPLHLAVANGHASCVQILLDAGRVDLEAKDKNKRTPLVLAKRRRHKEIAALLSEEMKKRNVWLAPTSAFWSILFGGSQTTKTKSPMLFFVGSFLLWCYPVYFFKYIPLTWNKLRASHYCFVHWNVLMWISWTIAHRKDPGYLPLNSENYSRVINQIPAYEKYGEEVLILQRLCHTCRCVRPLRAKHCRVCNRCVAYFDHHCPFIYNCVGIKNRLWFFFFVLCTAINCSFIIYFSITCASFFESEVFYALSLILSGTFCCFGWILTGVSLLHACMNLTTNEMLNYRRYSYLKDRFGKYNNAFSKGLVLNLLEFFTHPYTCNRGNTLVDEVL